MQAQQKLFIIALAAVVVVFIGLMAIVYASLIPHFKEIGDWAVWLLRLLMVCVGSFAVAFTVFKILSMYYESKFVQRGDVVSYLGRKKPYVVSADHEAAKIPRLLPAPKDETLRMDDETIIELAKGGATLMQIVEAGKPVDLKYNRVQAVVAAAKKRGDIL